MQIIVQIPSPACFFNSDIKTTIIDNLIPK